MNKPAKHPAAVELGRLGGIVRSEKKAMAVRENGKKGGRPTTKSSNTMIKKVKYCLPDKR